MTIDQLEMIAALVAEGSMQKAAKSLNKSQPSLSVGIKKVEDFYNIKLFSRESYRPTLTEEGKVFFLNAQQVLNSHRKLHKVATELAANIEPQIHIVADPIVTLPQVQGLLEKAAALSDITQLVLSEDVLEGPLNTLIEKKADFAIGYCPPHRSSEVDKKPIGQIELISVVKKGLNYKDLPNIVVSEVAQNEDEKPSGSPHRWYVSNHWRKEELILCGCGWGRMSKFKVKDFKDKLSVIKSVDRGEVQLGIFLMINKDRPLGKVGRQLWDAI